MYSYIMLINCFEIKISKNYFNKILIYSHIKNIRTKLFILNLKFAMLCVCITETTHVGHNVIFT